MPSRSPSSRSGALPRATRARRKPDAAAPLCSALTTFLDGVAQDAHDAASRIGDANKGPRHPYVQLINERAELLLRAIRASVRESVRQLPGRAQAGAVDAALRAVTPKITRTLR